jgi:hypothetical protein
MLYIIIIVIICVFFYVLTMPPDPSVPADTKTSGTDVEVDVTIGEGSGITGNDVNTAPDEAPNPGDQAGVNTPDLEPSAKPAIVQVPLVLYRW